jgi:NAD(P)-dependent dehydrogenase (short-subunit alcohol dehydrogenase family)
MAVISESSAPTASAAHHCDNEEYGMMFRDKVALVTGAGSGIGQAVTQLFSQKGATVAAIARREEHLRQWEGQDSILPVRADLTRPDDIRRMVRDVEAAFGRIDIVCNIAGIHDRLFPLDETSDDLWETVVRTNLTAPFQICREAIRGMVERGSGVILNFGSLASVRGLHGPSYNAAKAGLIGLTTSIAVGYASRGIRCNLVQSGGVKNTNIGRTSGGENHPQGRKLFMDIAANYPVQWTWEPMDIASTVLFLCSDDSRPINGAIIPVDGGMSAC